MPNVILISNKGINSMLERIAETIPQTIPLSSTKVSNDIVEKGLIERIRIGTAFKQIENVRMELEVMELTDKDNMEQARKDQLVHKRNSYLEIMKIKVERNTLKIKTIYML
jgi:hypothetical protein